MVAYDINLIKLEARKELARRSFWDYCKLMAASFYIEEKEYLKDLCYSLQDFIESDRKILVINMPPRL